MNRNVLVTVFLLSALFSGCGREPSKKLEPARREPVITVENIVPVRSGVDSNGNGALLVPKAAVFHKGGLNGVFVVGKDSELIIRWVSLGKSSGSDVVVLGGLDEGEMVVGSHDDRLREGITINVK